VGVIERVARAVGLMQYKNSGLYTAAKRSGTTANTVKKYLKIEGLGLKKFKGRFVIVKSIKERVEDAICDMNKGISASVAARKNGTTLRTLKKYRYKGRPVIKKVNGRWVSNYMCIWNWSVVFFGKLKNMDGNVMGNPQQLNLTPDDKYATILWQYDCDSFITPLNPLQICEYHPQRVLDMLRSKLVYTVKANPTVADRILEQKIHGPKAAAQATLDLGLKHIPTKSELREEMQLSLLDAYFMKYKLDFDDHTECGIDDNLQQQRPKFVAVSTFKKKKKLITKTKGKFEIIIRRGARAYHYPDKPANIHYNHDWIEEARFADIIDKV